MTTLRSIEERIDGILQAFGEELGQGPIDGAIPMAEWPPKNSQPARADAHLLNGPQMPDKANQQSDIDAILASLS